MVMPSFSFLSFLAFLFLPFLFAFLAEQLRSTSPARQNHFPFCPRLRFSERILFCSISLRSLPSPPTIFALRSFEKYSSSIARRMFSSRISAVLSYSVVIISLPFKVYTMSAHPLHRNRTLVPVGPDRPRHAGGTFLVHTRGNRIVQRHPLPDGERFLRTDLHRAQRRRDGLPAFFRTHTLSSFSKNSTKSS